MKHPLIWLMQGLAHVPLPVLRALGWGIGRLAYVFAGRRRKIALTNLRLCFPQWSERKRRAIARRNFVIFCQAFLDRAWLWHGRESLVRQRLQMSGAVHELQREGGIVILAPHFYGMDAGGSCVMQQIDRPGSTIYSTQSQATLDAWMRQGRARFGQVAVLARSEGAKPVIRLLREGRMLYLLPDMDFGRQDSIFVPFFGVEAATLPSVSRLARLGRATVVPVVTRMVPSGYEVRVWPAWTHYPSADVQADTRFMNQQLERYIQEMPEQYYWVHRRFKTRPEGEPSPY